MGTLPRTPAIRILTVLAFLAELARCGGSAFIGPAALVRAASRVDVRRTNAAPDARKRNRWKKGGPALRDPSLCSRLPTNSRRRTLRTHFPRARGAARGPPMGLPCPPLECRAGAHSGTAAEQRHDRRRRSRGAQVGRFSGFQIFRFPHMRHARRRPRKSEAGQRRRGCEPGNLNIRRMALLVHPQSGHRTARIDP